MRDDFEVPDDVETARAIKLEPDECAWDVDVHLPNYQGQRAEKHRCQQESLCQQSLEQEEMEGKEEVLARDGRA